MGRIPPFFFVKAIKLAPKIMGRMAREVLRSSISVNNPTREDNSIIIIIIIIESGRKKQENKIMVDEHDTRMT